jgi:hypothetical protein
MKMGEVIEVEMREAIEFDRSYIDKIIIAHKNDGSFDDYPLLRAVEHIRDEGRFIDSELFKILDHPEAEDFHLDTLIKELCDARAIRKWK